MRLNICLPDGLAEEVRRRDIAISAVCQRALREEVSRLRMIEDADDILVYVESEQAELDRTTWPGYDSGKPMLTYKRHLVGGQWELGWVLEYEDGDEYGAPPHSYFIGGELVGLGPGSPPIEAAREHIRKMSRDMEQITVDIGEPRLTVGFTGRWLVEPDPDETRTGQPGHDAGAYWGVALTRRGRIAVFAAPRHDRWAASLHAYDSLDAAANDGVPGELIALATAELRRTQVLWRDI
jgi:hypothetical protein